MKTQFVSRVARRYVRFAGRIWTVRGYRANGYLFVETFNRAPAWFFAPDLITGCVESFARVA